MSISWLWYYNTFVRCYHWGRLGEGHIGLQLQFNTVNTIHRLLSSIFKAVWVDFLSFVIEWELINMAYHCDKIQISWNIFPIILSVLWNKGKLLFYCFSDWIDDLKVKKQNCLKPRNKVVTVFKIREKRNQFFCSVPNHPL